MRDAHFQVILRLITMGLILAAIPQSVRDWAVWLLAALILFSEFGIEPLNRYILSRLPWYKEEDPEVAARGIKMVTYVGEFALALTIFVRM